MIRALAVGVVDGLHSPWDLGSGVTFGDSRDGAYDRGVNAGQRVGRMLDATADFLRSARAALFGPLT